MPVSVTTTSIPDVLIIEQKIFADERGFFFEAFNQKDFNEAIGQEVTFVQDNHSRSKKGVLRGLHYQMQHTQGKLARVTYGVVYDVVVDLRQSSPTFGQWVGLELSADNRKQLWVPAGFAHGFLVLSAEAEFIYKTTDYWHAASEQCIVWNDSFLNISWPKIDVELNLSDRDSRGLSWVDAPKYN